MGAHLALEDPSGDSAIIEPIDGELVVHHGAEYTVMANSPAYDEQLANLSRYEGFPTSVAEAMAIGIPCLVTRKSSMEEIAEDAALYVNAQKRDELVSSIRRLTEDEELRSHLIKEGRRHASRFRPAVMAFNLMKSYRRVDVDIVG
jgi:glycosyltransferase involved in cell wall biosynthesis